MATPRVLFLSNYPPGYVISARARHFADALSGQAETRIEYRLPTRRSTIRHIVAAVRDYRPHLIYTLDGLSGETVAFCARLVAGIPYIIDRANTLEDHLRESARPYAYWRSAAVLESLILGNAKAVVCRGINQTLAFRARYYNRRIVHLSEGTDLRRWVPKDGSTLRRRYALEDSLVIGTIGTAQWSEVYGHYFGRETVEVLRLMPDTPVDGVILPSLTSDPAALERLQELAEQYGVSHRLRIIRNVPRESVPDYLAVFDVCISTQLRSLSGEMRTTAKLPDYLACGKFVLSTTIGDARFYLPQEMLIEHTDDYYQQLARRIAAICENRSILKMGVQGVETARRYFDYEAIALQASALIMEVLGMRSPKSEASDRIAGRDDHAEVTQRPGPRR